LKDAEFSDWGAEKAGAGWVAGRGQDPNDWQQDITECISYIQAAITKVGDGDRGITDALASVLKALQWINSKC
jgi:hypothetical protein